MSQQSLVVFLADIEDTRKAKGRYHQQLAILIIMVMGMLCGNTSLKSIARFAKSHRRELAACLPLRYGRVPSYSTLQRTAHRLDMQQVCEAFNAWMAQFSDETMAIDGKSIRSTVQTTDEGKQGFVSLVSFFGQTRQLIHHIGCYENDKRSEQHLVQQLLERLDINKTVFTLDALHCQKKPSKPSQMQDMAILS